MSRRCGSGLALVGAVMLAAAAGCAASASDPPAEPGAELLGGETTVFDSSPLAFTLAARNLTPSEHDDFALGDHFFNRNWVAAPASTSANDGLGPLFNATSCSGCHLRDGRSKPPESPDDPVSGLLVRLSIPGADAQGGPLAEPSYGGQLQPFGIVGVPAEGRVVIAFREQEGSFADGERFSLGTPTYSLTDLAYGPMAAGALTSPRTAPAMIGLGLLEAVPEATLLALADPDDANHDGISGRPNRVWNVLARRATVGRFGWKANVPSVEQQVAGAFLGDIGVTTRHFQDENCTSAEALCTKAVNGGRPELSDETLDQVILYSRTLGVPARRNVADPDVRRGEALFGRAQCSACHLPKLETGDGSPIAALRRQTIRPYTDLLLHDMGEDLADGRPDFEASGTEWRTAPLWGIGLLETVSKHTRLLHDGRARGLSEAILWHGGEARASREAFRTMSKSDREALLAFLRSL